MVTTTKPNCGESCNPYCRDCDDAAARALLNAIATVDADDERAELDELAAEVALDESADDEPGQVINLITLTPKEPA